MFQTSRRFLPIAAAVLLLGGIVGGTVGTRAQADSRQSRDGLATLGQILALVEDQYVGEVDSEMLVEQAIDGMLRTLDPHSNYLDAEVYGEMRDEQRGRFSGLGIQITKRGADKPLTIISPIDDTPASRAGLRSGDIISAIEGKPTIELTVQDAVRLLKGEKGSKVTITIERPTVGETFDVTIERDEIPIESIRVAYMIEPGVGLVRVANFTTTTADELDRAMDRLAAEGMVRLILDLRGNPGGLLDQAVRVSERFLPEGKLIVYTRGRIPGSNQDFVARDGVPHVEYPLIVLVDGSSASASEIVSGAIQDHDRGLVVGETTFGKGLVQRVIPLRDHGALAVTTAKYYTPSGRLIQRDYSDLVDYYLHRDEETGDDPLLEGPEAAPPPRHEKGSEIYHTAAGRTVFGGGGISPDYVVASTEAPELLLQMLRENLIFDYSVAYVGRHPELEKPVRATPELLAEFKAFLAERKFDYTGEAFAESLDVISLRLRSQIARLKWDQVEESRVLAASDPQIQRALTLFAEAERLAALGADGEPGRAEPQDLRAEAGVGPD